MLKALRNRNGMTLVELIVAMLMVTVIATAVSTVLAPVLRVYVEANELAECNALLDNVANQITDDLYNATSRPVVESDSGNNAVIRLWTGDGYVEYSIAPDTDPVNNGVLLKGSAPDEDGRPVLSKKYYKNKSVSIPLPVVTETTEAYAFTLTVTILSDKDGRIMLSRDYDVRPLALNQGL